MKSTFTTVVLLSIMTGMSLPAQTEQRVLVGTRVRITMPDTMRISQRPGSEGHRFVIGQLVAMSDSSISVRHEASSADVTVPLSRVQRLEVSAGSRRREAAVIGGLVGLGLGGIFGYAGGDDCGQRRYLLPARGSSSRRRARGRRDRHPHWGRCR